MGDTLRRLACAQRLGGMATNHHISLSNTARDTTSVRCWRPASKGCAWHEISSFSARFQGSGRCAYWSSLPRSDPSAVDCRETARPHARV